MGRGIERHRVGRGETRQAIRVRAAAFTLLVGAEGGGDLDGVLLGVAAEGAQQVAAHRRVRFNQEPVVEEDAQAVAGDAVASALREHPTLLTEMGRPSDDVIEALGGVAAYYQLLEAAADMAEDDL